MNAVLVMKSACGAERIFPVRTPRTLIGRESRCHVRIALPSVSKRHCELKIMEGTVYVNDLRSENGTFINGRRIDRAVLSHEDQLTVGPVTFTVRVASNRAAAQSEQRFPVQPTEDSGPIVSASADQPEQDTPAPEIVSFSPQKNREAGSPRQPRDPQSTGTGDKLEDPPRA